MPRPPTGLARPLAVLCLIASATGLLPVPARAAAPTTAGEIRRRIEVVDRRSARVQAAVGRRSIASNRGTWLLFKARRALDLAVLELRNERIWGEAPDALKLSMLGPTAAEHAVATAR